MVKQSFQVLLLSLVIFISLAAAPLLGQDSRHTFEGGWTLQAEFSRSSMSIHTSCSGRIDLMIRPDKKMFGEWTVRASEPDATHPYPCEYSKGSIEGDLRDDGSVELQLFVEHRIKRDGMTTFEYVPWLQDFSAGSTCPVTEEVPWLGALTDGDLTIHGSAECTVQGRSIRATYLLRFDGSSE
jgi:hypothetical protein